MSKSVMLVLFVILAAIVIFELIESIDKIIIV